MCISISSGISAKNWLTTWFSGNEDTPTSNTSYSSPSFSNYSLQQQDAFEKRKDQYNQMLEAKASKEQAIQESKQPFAQRIEAKKQQLGVRQNENSQRQVSPWTRPYPRTMTDYSSLQEDKFGTRARDYQRQLDQEKLILETREAARKGSIKGPQDRKDAKRQELSFQPTVTRREPIFTPTPSFEPTMQSPVTAMPYTPRVINLKDEYKDFTYEVPESLADLPQDELEYRAEKAYLKMFEIMNALEEKKAAERNQWNHRWISDAPSRMWSRANQSLPNPPKWSRPSDWMYQNWNPSRLAIDESETE